MSRLILTAILVAGLVSSSLATAEPPKHSGHSGPGERRVYFRAGLVRIQPLTQSDELVMTEVDDVAGLALVEGPVAGSAARVEAATVPAVSIGYVLPWLDGRLSVETVLGLPVPMNISAEGSLETESLAPDAMGIPTGVPALGKEVGKAEVLPLILTTVYRHAVSPRLAVYGGGGVSYVIPYNARITNPILTEVSEPKLSINHDLGGVAQVGLDARVWNRVFVSLDIKYIFGFTAHAEISDIYVRAPGLPLYDTVRVGEATLDLPVNPLVISLGTGVDF